MKTTPDRRTFIRNVILGGFSLYLPACKNSPKEIKQEPTSAIDTIENIEKTVETIDEYFKSEQVVLLRKADEQYTNLNIGFNKRVPKNPKIIALCKNVKGISEAIKYAKFFKLQVCIKSGGHSFEGFSSNDGGMCINLSLLKDIEWINEETVKLGSGVILKEVYNALLPKGKIIPSGSCAGVGVAGLTLGGGYGLFSRAYGLTCDSLKELTMVDGEGNILSVKSDDELMWACRGGGNGNFGVISDMTFRVHQAPKIFTRHLFKAKNITQEKAISLLKDWFNITAQLPNSCFGAYVLNHNDLTVLVTDIDDKTEEIRTVLEGFGEKMDSANIGRKETDIPRALRRYYGIQTPLFFKNACAGLYNGFGDIENCIESVVEQVFNNRGLIYQVNTLGGNIQNPEFEKASAYPHRAYPYLSELQAYYDKPERKASLLAAFQEIQETFTNNGLSAHYRNYPDINFENWQSAYYGKNYARLQKIKGKYDPDNVIWHPQSIRLVSK
ncbi:MAG: FAD-binding oxidoreductase [Bacteroidetes bacterium]|jgi:FAD/FMN-containing dehydrogenase|nr:FAD-binding oxidoreductase [Bacteroidota bacterium]MDF1868221.1 FAD-binding oxidoreductase [Saprospiraceae bacterium]